MTRTRAHRLATAALALVLGALFTGCAQTSHSEGSRHVLYGSTSELAADSSLIVVGSAGARAPDAKVDWAQTGTIVVIDDVLGGASGPDVKPGNTVVVWQLGDDSSAGPAPILKEGASYLLFLTPTGLPNMSKSDFYVTGGTAGLWLSSDKTGSFTRSGDEGDTLPETLSTDELRALLAEPSATTTQ